MSEVNITETVKKLWDDKRVREKVLYLFFGGLTTVVNIGSYCLLVDVLHIHYLISNAVSWVAAVLFAYVTNKKYVFESNPGSKLDYLREMFSFIGFRAASGGIDMLLMFALVSGLSWSDKPAKAAVSVLVVILNYVFSKFFVFKSSGEKK